jgi:hypothetical protein
MFTKIFYDQIIFRLITELFDEEVQKTRDKIDKIFDLFVSGSLDKSFYTRSVLSLYPSSNFDLLDVYDMVWLILNWPVMTQYRTSIYAIVAFCLVVMATGLKPNFNFHVTRDRVLSSYHVLDNQSLVYDLGYSELIHFNRKLAAEFYGVHIPSPASVIFAAEPVLPTVLPTILGLGDPPGSVYWVGIASDYYLNFRINAKVRLGVNYFGNPGKCSGIVQYPITLNENLNLNQNLILFDYSEIESDGKRHIYEYPHIHS